MGEGWDKSREESRRRGVEVEDSGSRKGVREGYRGCMEEKKGDA